MVSGGRNRWLAITHDYKTCVANLITPDNAWFLPQETMSCLIAEWEKWELINTFSWNFALVDRKMNYFVFWEQLREIHYKTSLTQ
jgi:hypothetical protein